MKYMYGHQALLLKDRSGSSVLPLRQAVYGRYCRNLVLNVNLPFHPACDHWKLDMDNASQPHMQRMVIKFFASFGMSFCSRKYEYAWSHEYYVPVTPP